MIETKSAHISLIDEGTIKVVFKPNVLFSVEEYETYPEIYKSLSGVEKIKLLIITQEGFSLDGGSINFLKNQYKTDYKKAEAHIIVPYSQRIFFKAGSLIVKRDFPAKLFKKEEEALEWLKTIK